MIFTRNLFLLGICLFLTFGGGLYAAPPNIFDPPPQATKALKIAASALAQVCMGGDNADDPTKMEAALKNLELLKKPIRNVKVSQWAEALLITCCEKFLQGTVDSNGQMLINDANTNLTSAAYAGQSTSDLAPTGGTCN